MFRTSLFSAIVLCASIASADWWTIQPDYAGGYRTRHSNGYTQHITPDYIGGWNIRANDGSRATIRQDFMGGYRVQTYRPVVVQFELSCR